jgi:universal stress protein E
MNQARRILLVGHTQQRKSAAFQRAVALAMVSGTPLHISVLVEPFVTYALLGSEIREQLRHSLLNEQRRCWNEEVEILRGKGIQATCSVAWAENLHEEILCHVRELQPVMLVKDIQREPVLKRAFVTPLDWHLLRSCPVPLHLVSDARHPTPRVVVAAVDLADPDVQYSSLNDQIIVAGISLATQCGAEFRLLYVHDNMPAYMVSSGEAVADWVDIVEELRVALHQSFVDLAERHDVPQERRHFIVGQPITGVIEFAQERQADVVVMGRVHRQVLDKWIGSTTEAVLYRLPGSVLAIRPGDGATGL